MGGRDIVSRLNAASVCGYMYPSEHCSFVLKLNKVTYCILAHNSYLNSFHIALLILHVVLDSPVSVAL